MSHAAERQRFDAVVERVAEPVRRYLHRRAVAHVADDVFAEVLVVLWRRLDAIPEAEEIAWAVGIARLQLANAERSQRRQRLLFRRVATLDPPTSTSVEENPHLTPSGADSEGLRENVAAVMNQLRAGDAEILRLWSWEELAPREIAVVLEISVNAATVRLHRARKRFATAWSKAQDHSGHEQVKEGSEQ